MKIHPVEAKLVCTYGWTDTDRHDEANITFYNFANESKNLYK
jgi:hypothetical protein